MVTPNAGYPSSAADDDLRRSRRQVTDTYQLGLVNNTWGSTAATRSYDQSRSSLMKQYGRMREGLSDNVQGRGLLNSGIWQKKLTDFYGDKNTALGDLQSRYADQLGQLGGQREAMTGAYDGGMADINESLAGRQAAIAEALRSVRAGY